VERDDGPDGPETVLHAPEIVSAIAPYDLVRQMRASFNVLGPLVAGGHARFRCRAAARSARGLWICT